MEENKSNVFWWKTYQRACQPSCSVSSLHHWPFPVWLSSIWFLYMDYSHVLYPSKVTRSPGVTFLKTSIHNSPALGDPMLCRKASDTSEYTLLVCIYPSWLCTATHRDRAGVSYLPLLLFTILTYDRISHYDGSWLAASDLSESISVPKAVTKRHKMWYLAFSYEY